MCASSRTQKPCHANVFKMKNFLHHLEYEESGLRIEDVKKIVEEIRLKFLKKK